jgi:hypothetical protein
MFGSVGGILVTPKTGPAVKTIAIAIPATNAVKIVFFMSISLSPTKSLSHQANYKLPSCFFVSFVVNLLFFSFVRFQLRFLCRLCGFPLAPLALP